MALPVWAGAKAAAEAIAAAKMTDFMVEKSSTTVIMSGFVGAPAVRASYVVLLNLEEREDLRDNL